MVSTNHREGYFRSRCARRSHFKIYLWFIKNDIWDVSAHEHMKPPVKSKSLTYNFKQHWSNRLTLIFCRPLLCLITQRSIGKGISNIEIVLLQIFECFSKFKAILRWNVTNSRTIFIRTFISILKCMVD